MKCGPRESKTKKKNKGAAKKKKKGKGNGTGDRRACGSEKAAGRRRAKNVTRGGKKFFKAFKRQQVQRGRSGGNSGSKAKAHQEGWVFFFFH